MAKLLDLLPFVLSGGTIVDGRGERVRFDSSGDIMMPDTGFLSRRHLEDDTWRRELPSGLTFGQAIEHVLRKDRVRRASCGIVLEVDHEDDLVAFRADATRTHLRSADLDATDWEVIDG